MANQEHLDRLEEGINVWNSWIQQSPSIRPDLSRADLSHANLRGADLYGADLYGANLRFANLRFANLIGTNLIRANLIGAHLIRADLIRADLTSADLSGVDLKGAKLIGANLRSADLSFAHLRGADLTGADLTRATLVETDFTDTILSNCHVYGTSVWKVKLQRTKQNDLIITPKGEAIITVDTLEVAQFVYLLLSNEKIRDVINTLTTKAVLILGRFSPERKAVLDAIRDELRKHNYLPILFDFDGPENRTITETVTTLARLSRFIVADLTDPASIPQELAFIVPNLPSVPVQPLLLSSKHEYAMYKDFTRYPWVLPIFHYTDQTSLLQSLKEHVIDPAELKAQGLVKR